VPSAPRVVAVDGGSAEKRAIEMQASVAGDIRRADVLDAGIGRRVEISTLQASQRDRFSQIGGDELALGEDDLPVSRVGIAGEQTSTGLAQGADFDREMQGCRETAEAVGVNERGHAAAWVSRPASVAIVS